MKFQNIDADDPNAPRIISDNVVQPFQLESSNLRGRIVSLGSVLDDILNPHDYPDNVSQLLGETVTLCALLSSMLKYDGVFTLQAQGDGPIQMLLSDMTTQGGIRGCATFNEDRVQEAAEQLSAFSEEVDESSDNQLAQLLGKGYIAFTVDQGAGTDRYQGIVELKGASLVDCVQHYFVQSEQIGTGIILAVGKRDGHWRASGIMLQHMPEDNVMEAADIGNTGEDDWRRTMILLQSCTEEELLKPDLEPCELLRRLFHEEGVRVFSSSELYKECRCSDEKVENILMMMGEEDRDYMAEDGDIKMTCEFCSKDYVFSEKEIEKKVKLAEKQES